MGLFNEKWADVPEDKRKEAAVALFKSVRGRYIIGQALAYAIDQIMEQPKAEREVSNAADMHFLGENLFDVGFKVWASGEYINEKENFMKMLDKLSPGNSEKGT